MQEEHATGMDAMELRAVAQRYTGPGARDIAQRIPHPVVFERGWFRTTTAVCHGSDDPDGLAFRQRPDGNGIDVRCHSGGCTRAHIVTAIEGLIGLAIWTAYEPAGAGAAPFAPATLVTTERLLFWCGGMLALAVPLLLGHGYEAAFLNVIGYSLGYALMGHFATGWLRAARRHG
ncbi:MAG: hypothetical protein OXC71_02575 [Chloroflexi bacterium]|nr:hypothetical protein [Chloroflexota bacterium]